MLTTTAGTAAPVFPVKPLPPPTPQPAAAAVPAARQSPGVGETAAGVARALAVLTLLIEVSGKSRRQLEKTLSEQGAGTDLGRLFSGRLDLKVRHVLDLCRVLGVTPQEVFAIAYRPPRERSLLLRRVHELMSPDRAPLEPSMSAGAEIGVEDLKHLQRQLAELTGKVDDLLGKTLAATTARFITRRPT